MIKKEKETFVFSRTVDAVSLDCHVLIVTEQFSYSYPIS